MRYLEETKEDILINRVPVYQHMLHNLVYEAKGDSYRIRRLCIAKDIRMLVNAVETQIPPVDETVFSFKLRRPTFDGEFFIEIRAQNKQCYQIDKDNAWIVADMIRQEDLLDE